MTLARMLRVVAAAACVALLPYAQAAEMRAFDAGSLQAIKSAHAGQPFVLAFWSIHCAPCIEDMADWNALQWRHPKVPIVLVTTDGPAEHARAARMLVQYPPGNVERWAFADDYAERTRYSIDAKWRGELPRTYYFDAAHVPEVVSGRLDRRWAEAWFARH